MIKLNCVNNDINVTKQFHIELCFGLRGLTLSSWKIRNLPKLGFKPIIINQVADNVEFKICRRVHF